MGKILTDTNFQMFYRKYFDGSSLSFTMGTESVGKSAEH